MGRKESNQTKFSMKNIHCGAHEYPQHIFFIETHESKEFEYPCLTRIMDTLWAFPSL